MSLVTNTYRTGLTLLVAAGLLGACKSSGTDDPAPTSPTTPTTPTTPGTPPPPQYGTPFASVPSRENAVLYQVNMRAFSQGGNFAGVTARLDSIRDLGVNVLYLMPIYPIGTDSRSVNSPYAVKDYQAVNPEFGSLTDLRTLVDGAHARGMAVMLDWVANHTSWDNPWITQHPEWYQKNAAGAITPVSNNGTTYNDVAQLNFSNATMRLEMISALKSWVYTANVDGFRFDYADFQPTDFWKQATDTLRNIKTHKLLLLAESSRAANFSSGFDYNFGFNWYGGIYQVYKNGSAATALDVLNTSEYSGATGTQQVVRYITNHDVNGSDGTPVELFGGKAGAMSAFVVTTLYKGVPMIYNGQEAGMSQRIPFPFTGVKVRWGQNPDVKRAYQQLLTARAGSAALRVGTPAAYSTANVCAFTKTAGSEQALVLANVRNSTQTYTVPATLANTTWTDALAGGSVALGTQVSLPPYGYMVLKK